ncbi:hypothetical protein WA026_006281 [Henosepilachna vigintioctopunctata]|uniref:UDP-glucuronosyltransferase n=1 Tax=Henosepilachna vigintioctopunctata TaxID=420089 RepID=A0AAW1TQ54_9CUCU
MKGLTQIHLKGIFEYKERMSREQAKIPSGGLQTMKMMKRFFSEISDLFWEDPGIQKIIKEKPKFDVFILLGLFNDANLGLGHHLGIPTILFSPVGSNSLVNFYVANPNMVYVSNVIKCFLGLFVMPHQRELLKKYLPDSPPIEELHKNISLMLLNSHFSIEPPRPHVPNAITIGGYHLDVTKELPEDIKTFLDNAHHGAILFSMGSNVEISKFEEEKLNAIFKVLGELGHMKILFKSEMEHKDVPKNIMLKKWLPQADILAHPNVKAFISHGGLGGNTEAVYHGVPIVGIPFFGDQKMNIEIAVSAGYAVDIPFEALTENLFRGKLKEVLENPRYAENAKKRSALIKGQLIKPMDNAAFGLNTSSNTAAPLSTDVWSDRHLKLSDTVVSFVNREVTPRAFVYPSGIRSETFVECGCVGACVSASYKINRPGTSGVKRAASKENESVSVTKKRETRPRDKDQEEMIMEWLNESSESDSDNIDPNFLAESNHDSASEQEGSDSERAEEQEIESNVATKVPTSREIFICVS